MKTEFKRETILRAFGLTALEVIKTALVGRECRSRVAYLWVIRKKIERGGRGRGGRERERKKEGGKRGGGGGRGKRKEGENVEGREKKGISC